MTSWMASRLFEPGSFGGSTETGGNCSGDEGRTGVDGRILTLGGGDTTRFTGGGEPFRMGDSVLADGAIG
jgi:hypothetical protein